MRRFYKKQCLETLAALLEVHNEVMEFINKGRTEEAVSLLGECQQGAVSIGTMIEKTEGEGTQEVSELEKYCELLYVFHKQIVSGESINLGQMSKKLKHPLTIVSNGIKNRFPTQKEVVFLPYKASMWDSLETVWKKMKDDEDTTTYVIPIPYFDRRADGTFTAMHYERDEFPDDVPTVSYEDYSIENRHPDVIYIHNPYDDSNFVTSVHPDYYASKLKNETDELVYIPYFILGAIDPDDKKAVKDVEHFIKLPGVVHAHRVIVQSEDWRKVYIRVMTEFAGKQTKSIWENKIEGTGSPKIERIKNLTPDDFKIPSEWEDIIKKEDGSRKKIIFYNTTVGALLKGRDKMLDKMDRVFKLFKENTDDTALLWRPHPLIEATIASLAPDLWERYKDMTEKYINEAWGIYDDTPAIDRAIIISDAYYGDWSSVVWLYEQTGKPIMIEKVEDIEDEETAEDTER
ncbi:MAG: hypothetical protein K6F00_11480 [Lachnospiraceae bacterium]|nr:hypothetical protein [Lachnospiraceae bacterium]